MNWESSEARKKYLLGELGEAERQEFECALLAAPEQAKELEVAEQELIDDYLSGALTPPERERFNDYFLSSPARQRQLLVSQTLTQYAPTQADAQPAQTSVPQRGRVVELIRAVFFGSRGAFALATLLLLSFGLMSLLAWQLWQEKRQAQQLVAQTDASRKELAQRLNQLEQAGGEQLKQEREKRVAAEALAEQLKNQLNASQTGQQNIPVYARRLSAEKGAGDELSLNLSANTQAFTLTLFKSKPYEFPEYALEIVDQRGQPVREFSGLKPVGDEGTLNLTLNRAGFAAGKYQLRLFGQHGKTKQKIGQYELSVSYAR